MIVRKILIVAGLAAFVIAATMAAVTAGAFALYTVLEAQVGAAAAEGILALAALLAAALAVFLSGKILGRRKGGDRHPREREPDGLGDTATRMLRERPIISAVAGVAASLIALRNPAMLSTLMAAFLARGAPKDKRRR